MPLSSLTRLLAIAAACVPVAATASAGETVWRVYDDARRDARGAVICPQTVPRRGDYVCLALDCRDTGPLALRLTASVEVFPDLEQPARQARSVPGRLVIDGRAFPPAIFYEPRRQKRERLPTEFLALLDPRRDAALVAALKAGQEAALVIGPQGAARRLDLSLDGAGAAIDRAQALCPVARYRDMAPAAVQARPFERPQPGHRLAELRRACRALSSEMEIGADFARPVDADGDGGADLILDYGAVSCGDGTRPLCDVAGCVTELWLEQLNRPMQVVSEPLEDLVLAADGVIALRRPAASCGGAGPPCVTRLRAENGVIWRLD